MDERKLDGEIENALDNVGITLVKTNASDYQDVNFRIMDRLVNDKGIPGLYVTVNKPYKTIEKLLDERELDSSRIFFIDAITKKERDETRDANNVVFIESPQRLTDLSIAIKEAVESMPDKEKFLFFDSISMLTTYSDSTTVAKFAHYLTTNIREWDIAGVIISVSDTDDDEVVSRLTQFCDHLIEV